MALTEEMVAREKRRIARTAIVGACFYLVPLGVVGFLRGASPWEIPYYHVAIPIAVLCLVPFCYIMMPLFDGAMVFGRPRPTTARAALIARCVLANAIGLMALWVFFHGQSLSWFLVIWALGLPAALGILRRIAAYQRVLAGIVDAGPEEDG